jgi:hypothetical protein
MAIISSVIGMKLDRNIEIMHRKFTLYALITVQVQVLLGIISYTKSHYTIAAMNNFGAAMKDSLLRLLSVEHPLLMIIAAVVFTVGYIQSRRADEIKNKYKRIAIFYSIGLLLVLSRIPWSQWDMV